MMDLKEDDLIVGQWYYDVDYNDVAQLDEIDKSTENYIQYKFSYLKKGKIVFGWEEIEDYMRPLSEKELNKYLAKEL